jgi:branched-chain amino acid transport system substrate-binding protein
MAWFGEQHERGVDLAVAELNEAGGLLGKSIEVVHVDDYCEGEQGVAAARKLIADGVVFVAGHLCSGAAIPASALYEEAGIIMISGTATNPKLTEQGLGNVFRVVNRDSEQARLAGEYLAAQWADAKIAILHDGTVYGQDLAEETRRQLNRRGLRLTQFGEIVPGQPEYIETVAALQAAGIEVLFYGGYTAEAALIARHAHDRDYELQLLGGDNLNGEYFLRVAGLGAEGVRFVSMADPRRHEAAAPIVAKFRADGYEPEGFTLYGYAVVQVWAQAVEKAGTFEAAAVVEALRDNEFDTVLGRLGFDDKGDVTGVDSFIWYVWSDTGYHPAEKCVEDSSNRCDGLFWSRAPGTPRAIGRADAEMETVLGIIGLAAGGDVKSADPLVGGVWTDGKCVPKDLID